MRKMFILYHRTRLKCSLLLPGCNLPAFNACLMKDKLPIKSGLYITATPIGNLRDITFRALDVLQNVDAVLCEDTRVTAKLMWSYGIKKTLVAYHDHNADRLRPKILAQLRAGAALALVSDAGTPLISDPGYKLVYEARKQGIKITPVPGPTAVIAALSATGMPCNHFSFFGFLPEKVMARREFVTKLKNRGETLIFFESAKRAAASLRDLANILGGHRPAALARELTKIYEEILTDSLGNLADVVERKSELKGEIVLLVGGHTGEPIMQDHLQLALAEALKTLSVRDASALVAALSGQPKKTLYAAALRLKKST